MYIVREDVPLYIYLIYCSYFFIYFLSALITLWIETAPIIFTLNQFYGV